MADVVMEYKGKRKRVPEAQVERFRAMGAVEVAPKDEDDGKPGMLKSALAGLSKFATGGLTDEFAGLGAGAGRAVEAVTQGASPAEAFYEFGEGRDEGAKERLKYEEDAYQANPGSYVAGGVTGALGTAPLTKGRTAEGTVARSTVMGGVGGYGTSESDSVMGDLMNAYIGASLGGAGAVALPAVVSSLRSLPGAAKAGLGKVGGLLKSGSDKAAALAEAHPIASGLAKTAVDVVAPGARTGLDTAKKALAALSKNAPDAPPMVSNAPAPKPLKNAIQYDPATTSSSADFSAQYMDDAVSAIDDDLAGALSRQLDDAPEEVVSLVQKKAAAPPAAPEDVLSQAIDDVDEAVPSSFVKKSAREWGAGGPTAEKRAAIEEFAAESMERFGTLDAAFLNGKTGIPTADLARILPEMVREMKLAPRPQAPALGVRGRQRASSGFDPEKAKQQVAAGKEASKMTARERAAKGFR